jgi:hypothetical protein
MEQTIKNVTGLAMKAGVTIDNKINSDLNLKLFPQHLEGMLLNFVTNGLSNIGLMKELVLYKNYTTFENKDFAWKDIDLKRKNRDKLFGMYKTFHNNKKMLGNGTVYQ